MVAASKLKSQNVSTDEANRIALEDGPTLLSSAAIYGANASGKSNLIAAMGTMTAFVRASVEGAKQTGSIPVDSHRLSIATKAEPTRLELVFRMDGHRYRYGFAATVERVIEEWLYWVPTKKEALLFHRRMDKYELGRGFRDGRGVTELTRPNALLLSVAAQFNGPISGRVAAWFEDRLNVVSGLQPEDLAPYSLRRYFSGESKDQILDLVRKLDLGIADLRGRAMNYTLEDLPPDASDELRKLFAEHPEGGVTVEELVSVHTQYSPDGEPVGEEVFSFSSESDGTQKLFALAGMLVKTLSEGGVLAIDELDSRLHPMITRSLVGLFCSKDTNPKGAQLVFTTQDTNLLDNKLLRRDQIWFVEKDRQGASHLYSLAEFKEPVRNDANYERNYIRGRYGAVPYLGDLASLWSASDAEA
jgi:hypothetical protein